MIVLFTIIGDILFTSLLIYIFYRFFKGTHTAAVAKGLLALMAFYVVSLFLNFTTVTWIFDRLIANFPVIIAVLFQQELRRFFATIGKPKGRNKKDDDFIHKLAETLAYMSKNRIGALIIVEDRTRLDDIIANGIVLDAEFSPELLLTIFYKGTDLHDGAVVIRGEKIYAAQVFLPVDFSTSTKKGTRHEAGVSFTYGRSCTALIVSEETGEFSYAQNNDHIVVPRRKIEEVLYDIFS
ncbi:MAG: diadenylate cyclase CdaA [Brevinema sp.]